MKDISCPLLTSGVRAAATAALTDGTLPPCESELEFQLSKSGPNGKIFSHSLSPVKVTTRSDNQE
jgi:hypothetical protein